MGLIGQYLKPRDYQTGIRVVEAVTSKPGQYPPTKGDICKVWDDIAQEGTPNAPGQRCAGPLDNAAVQWQKQLTSMSDEEYQRLLHERRRE
jgi:hypothetical protein